MTTMSFEKQLVAADEREYFFNALEKGEIFGLSWLLGLYFGFESNEEFHKGELLAIRKYIARQIVTVFFSEKKLETADGVKLGREALEKLGRFSITDDRFEPVALALTNQLMFIKQNLLRAEIWSWITNYNSRQPPK